MDEMEIKSTGCLYQPRGVQCIEKNKCGKCGWNPAVEQQRKGVWRRELHQGAYEPVRQSACLSDQLRGSG